MSVVARIKKLALVVILFVFSGLAFSWYTSTKQQAFRVSEVIDGDTIRLEDGRRIRYISVDSPELSKGEKEDECFAQEAKRLNEKLVLGKKIRLEFDTNEMDRFGRYLAYVYLKNSPQEEIFLNEHLLAEGRGEFQLDTVNLRYQSVLIKAAETASQEKKGLWGSCAPDPKVGCQIKGNLDKWDQRWYHLPSFRHYDQIVINLDHGDRWFCSEQEAQKAGFKRARE